MSLLCESCYDALHKQATTLADVVTGDIYIGMANNSNWAQVRRKLDTAVPNATFNPGSSMQFDSTTVQVSSFFWAICSMLVVGLS